MIFYLHKIYGLVDKNISSFASNLFPCVKFSNRSAPDFNTIQGMAPKKSEEMTDVPDSSHYLINRYNFILFSC